MQESPDETRRDRTYEAPEIVYEGDLEVQTGSPTSALVWDDPLSEELYGE